MKLIKPSVEWLPQEPTLEGAKKIIEQLQKCDPEKEKGKEITEARIRALERLRNDRDKQCKGL